MLRQFSYQDQLHKQGKAIHLGIIMSAAEVSEISCPFNQYQANIIQIVLFLCLRSCKYTEMNLHKLTVQFHIKDLQFHDVDRFIPHDTP